MGIETTYTVAEPIETEADKKRRAKAHAEVLFLERGVQYYVSARFAAEAGLQPVSGNLYHHAIEMFLKSRLTYCGIALSDLAKKGKFSHDLTLLWTAFKKWFPTEDLSPFDRLITELNRFEDIRYPDGVLTPRNPPPKGGGLTITIDRSPAGNPTAAAGDHEFRVVRAELDKFVAKVVQLINSPRGLVALLHHNRAAIAALLENNAEMAFWEGKGTPG